MTEHERNLRRGQLLVQIEDADEELGLLRGDAIGMAKALRHNANLDPSPHDFTPEGDVNNRLTPDEVATFVTVTSVSKLIEELKKSRQDVFNLGKQKAI